jgi:SH3-like domain-containing protein
MKRTKVILFVITSAILALIVVAPVASESVYVTARISPLMAEASTGAARLAALRQGDELSVVSTQGNWLKVQTADGTAGWIQKLFVGAEPSQRTVSRSAGIGNISTVATRRRASAYSTSAAATRGLAADDVRSRQNLAFSRYDFDAIEWLASFSYTEDEVVSFAESQGIWAF